jgi:signal transduction histidine kinase
LACAGSSEFALDRHLLAKYLERHGVETRPFEHGQASGLEEALPRGSSGHVVVPFMLEAQPLICIVVTTQSTYSTFAREDQSLFKTISVILGAYIVQRRVVAADASKTTFLSSISHELRTPLHGILAGLELARGHVRGEAKEAMDMVEASASTLDHILNDVLDFARLSHGGFRAEHDVDLQALTRKTMHISRAEGHGEVELVFESTGIDWRVRFDQARYQR